MQLTIKKSPFAYVMYGSGVASLVMSRTRLLNCAMVVLIRSRNRIIAVNPALVVEQDIGLTSATNPNN